MEAKEVMARVSYAERLGLVRNPAGRSLLEVVETKQTNMCLATYIETAKELLQVAKESLLGQRHAISEAYYRLHKESLLDRLRFKLSDNFVDSLIMGNVIGDILDSFAKAASLRIIYNNNIINKEVTNRLRKGFEKIHLSLVRELKKKFSGKALPPYSTTSRKDQTKKQI